MNKDQNINEKKIIFISSYPKSGNTWIRIVLSSLLNKNRGLFELKNLEEIKLFSQFVYFSHFENLKYQSNGNLDLGYVSNNWINAQKRINQRAKKVRFFKTHCIRGVVNGNFFTNENVCLGYIYVIRDPRDVVISVSKHMGISIDEAIQIMLFNNKFVTSAFKVNEPVGTWKNHLKSWLDFKKVSRLIIKYEDMISNSHKTIDQIIKYLKNTAKIQVNKDQDLINNILQSTNFTRLQKLEKKTGFDEASDHSVFFRAGKSKQWKNILTIEQIKLIEKELYDQMIMLGYL